MGKQRGYIIYGKQNSCHGRTLTSLTPVVCAKRKIEGDGGNVMCEKMLPY